MQILILSDIHGNVSALEAVLQDVQKRFCPDGVVLLGDNIDYGMRSNEVIERLQKIPYPILCNLWGNHEYAIMTQDYENFSSERGVQCAKRTRSTLTEESIKYLDVLDGKEGKCEFTYAGRKFLAIHGNIQKPHWGGIKAGDVLEGYEKYEYVLSGHTHYAHSFPMFYKSDSTEYRNKKRTVFINPGSVGQPRNHDPKAQYAVLDFDGGVYLCGVEYDVKYEQNLFDTETDTFYKDRLALGV